MVIRWFWPKLSWFLVVLLLFLFVRGQVRAASHDPALAGLVETFAANFNIAQAAFASNLSAFTIYVGTL